MNRMLRTFEIGDRAFGWVVLLLMVAFMIHRPLLLAWDDRTTPQPWLEVSVDVEDTRAGRDPLVHIDRNVKRTVSGQWSVKITKAGNLKNYVCSGSDGVTLDTRRPGSVSMSLSMLLRTRCKMDTGLYEICIYHDVSDAAGTRRFFGPSCSRFRIKK